MEDKIESEKGKSQRFWHMDGWLVMLPIALITGIIRLLISITTGLTDVLTNETWACLTQKESPAYNRNWLPLVVFEFLAQFSFLIISLILLRLFFIRHQYFPRYAIMASLGSSIFVSIDFFWADSISAIASDADFAPWKELVMSIVVTVIVVSYLLKSKSVKARFGRLEMTPANRI
jgi:hypothetical protein